MMQTVWSDKLRSVKNHTLAFAKKIEIGEKSSHIEIVAANLYRIFINGNLVGYGPARTAHGFVRADKYDLSEYKNSEIVIVVEVFAANVNSYYLVDELPFFGANIYFDNKIVSEASDFKAFLMNDRVRKVQRYSYQRPFAESYQMNRCRSNFYNGDFDMFEEIETNIVDSNKIIDRNIIYPEFNPVKCTDEIESGKVFINKENWKWNDRCLIGINDNLLGYKYEELEECISDEVCEFDYAADADSDALDINKKLKHMTYRIFDFGRTYTGFFNLKLNVIEKSTVYIIFDEIIWDEEKPDQKANNICFYRNTCCNIIKYNLEKGSYDLLAFEPSTVRYAKVIVSEGEISLNSFTIIPYENKQVNTLEYNISDSKLDMIVKSAAHTLAQNSVDILTDCPSRERAGWLCDGYFSSRAEKLFTGKNEIERNFLENFVIALQLKTLPDGMFPMCYPCDHYDGVYIPNWSMWYVLELSDYYKRTGDIHLVDDSKEKIYNLINFFKKYINDDGLLENLESWVFIEWSKCNDAEYTKGVNYPSNMLYSEMLCVAGRLYGDTKLIDQGNDMKSKIIEQSFNGQFFEDNKIRENGILTSKNHLTETCQYYAFYFNVANKNEFNELFNLMKNVFGPNRDFDKTYPEIDKSNAIVGNYLRLELLLENGDTDLVIKECKDFFTQMAERTGTLWEHNYAIASLNHGFASVAANYIIEALTGFVIADYNKKIIYFREFKGNSNIDIDIKIPVMNVFVKVDVCNNNRKILAPDGYSVEIL